ncbi:MAG: right-handed parallel beta-helix repeat-containing protein [Candidatus Xenobiia bacterium LiM19]
MNRRAALNPFLTGLLFFAAAVCLFIFLGAGHTSPLHTGTDIQGLIDRECAAGRKRIVIPPGRYRMSPRGGSHLSLKNLADVCISAEGAEMICTETTRAIDIRNCRGLTIQGLAIDYDPLPFTQGRITALTPDRRSMEIELLEGYGGSDNVEKFKFEIFGRSTSMLCAPDYVIKLEKTGKRHLRITKSHSSTADPEEAGDSIVIATAFHPGGYRPHAVAADHCTGLTLRGITLYSSPCMGFFEHDCDGSRYFRCRIRRRPQETDLCRRAAPRLRSLNADAFHSKHAAHGPSYIDCEAAFMGDDGVNICGEYYLILSSLGREFRIISRGSMNLEAGAPVELLSYDGRRLPDGRVTAVEPCTESLTARERALIGSLRIQDGIKGELQSSAAKLYRVTVAEDAQLPAGSLIAPLNKKGDGFLVKGCNFSHNRSRGILVKASDGKIIGSHLEDNRGPAILVTPEYFWLESGCSDRVTISGNTIQDCADTACAVTALSGSGKASPPGAHNNITIEKNSFTGCPLPNILITSCNQRVLRDNAFSRTGRALSSRKLKSFGLDKTPTGPVVELNCTP